MTTHSELLKTWEDEYRIHSYEVDVNSQAKLTALCQCMQESAWNHAEHLGLGYTHLIKKGYLWVLLRQKLKIAAYPKWGQKIKIHTWPTGRDKLYCFRDFAILDDSDNVLGIATTSWFVIDLNTRRPQRTDTYFHLELPENFECVFKERLDKLAPLNAPEFNKSFLVGYRDVDVNAHVNNVKYVEWILESFGLDFLKKHKLENFEINFLSECAYNDEIIVCLEKQREFNFAHNILRKSDNLEICRAKSSWKVDHS